MQQVTAYKRGWVAEAPAGALEAAINEKEKESATKTDNHARPQFERQADGSWQVVLHATEETKSFADVTLDISRDCLRITFPQRSPQLLSWPQGTGAEQKDACSARFSKKRGELTITLPAAQHVEISANTPKACELEQASTHEVRQEECSPQEPPPCNGEKPAQADKEQEAADVLTTALRKAKADIAAWHPEIKLPPSGDSAPADKGNGPDQVALQMAGALMLHSASATGDVRKVQALLNAGVDANSADDSGVSALEKACIGANPEVVAALLAKGARVGGISSSNSTPLHRAVAAGPRGRGIVQTLCSRGANCKAKDSAGRTPLELAREMGLQPLPELL